MKVRSYELANIIFSDLPTGIYQWDDVSNGSDDWAGRNRLGRICENVLI